MKRKIMGMLLAAVMLLGSIAGIPPIQTAYAVDTDSLEETIESYTGGEGASGSLEAAVSGSIVTVTGSITNAVESLALYIDEGVTVKWQAQLSAKTDMDDYLNLIDLSSFNGTFEVVDGGLVSATKGYAIKSEGNTAAINVSGGEVYSRDSIGIYANGSNAAVTVSGGLVHTNTSFGYLHGAIRTNKVDSKVTVSGTGEVRGDSMNACAIHALGDVEIRDSAKLSAVSGGKAIYMGSADTELVIYNGTLVCESGVISVELGKAVDITVYDGTISASQKGRAINNGATGAITTIYGGNISAQAGIAIEGYTVNISGTAKIWATGNGEGEPYVLGYAIQGHSVTVTGGEVSATTGHAFYGYLTQSQITVSGGLVFSYADVIESTNIGEGVFYLNDYNRVESGFTGATGTGVVIGWDQAAGITSYTAGSSNDIVKSPDTAAAVWGTSGGESGLFYANGTASGFIPLPVTVEAGSGSLLFGGTATRTSGIEATIGFTTSEEGTAYYQVVEDGATIPGFDASNWTSLGSVSGMVTDKSVTLTAGAKDIYIVVVDAANNASAALKIDVGATFPKNPMPTLEVYTLGQITISGGDVIEGASSNTELEILTEPDSEIATLSDTAEGLTRITGLAKGTTSMVVSALGVTVTVPISVVDPPDGLKPVLSNGSAERTGNTAATVSVTTDKAGFLFYWVRGPGTAAPVFPDDAADMVPVEEHVNAGSVSVPVVLTAGAKDVYVLVVEEEYMLPSNILKLEVQPYLLTGTAVIDNTTPKIGDTLTASLSGGNNAGTLSYAWKVGGVAAGTGETYTVMTADLGKRITVTLTSSEKAGEIESAATAEVAKKDAPAAPAAPGLVSKTKTGVTLEANDLYEFSYDLTTWQSNTFTGLTPGTAYTFYQRVAATEDTLASAASEGFEVTTDPLVKTVSMGTQQGGLYGGSILAAAFLVTTTDIAAGAAITLNNTDNVTGINLLTTVTSGDSMTVLIGINELTPCGEHPLTLTIDGVTSESFTLTVLEIPVMSITVTGEESITTPGGTLQLGTQIAPDFATNQSVTWSITEGSAYATLSSTGLVAAVDNGTVTVRATAQDGSGVYGEKTITISGQSDDPDPGPIAPPTVLNITATPSADGTILEVSASGEGLSYQWQVKGSWIDIPGATSARYDYSGLEPGRSYTVRVIVTDAAGNSTISPEIRFTVGATPITGLPESYTLIKGKSVSFTPSPSGGAWTYDSDTLSLSESGGKATFTAKKAGKTYATYTAGGTQFVVTITINDNTIPQTGDTMGIADIWPYVLAASLCMWVLAMLIKAKRRSVK